MFLHLAFRQVCEKTKAKTARIGQGDISIMSHSYK